MERRRFGAKGPQVAVVGQGTWRINKASGKGAIDALRRGLDLGMTHIDTAEYYGEAEDMVARAIDGRREDVFLVSKVMPQNATRAGTVSACERSLRKLQTDHLDCYLLHWRGSPPLAETIAGFEDLREAGKIASWGVSNFDVEDLDEALAIAGGGRIACNQVLYHLGERTIEQAVIPWCEEHDVAVVAYTPFGPDDFPSPRSKGGRVIGEIAEAHGATARQVALRFLTRRESVFTIPKAERVAHVEDNAGAGSLKLSREEIARIDEAFPCPRARGALPML